MSPKVIDNTQKLLLAAYAEAAHKFSDSVDRLQEKATNAEAFIEALEATGTAHRACERSRVQLQKYLTQQVRSTV
ncbi:MAG: hypothetical protein WDO18_10940 [Acidobacteriota bacterium]